MPHVKSRISLPSMTPGTARNIVVHRFGKTGARPEAYLQASIHANELPGAMVLHHLVPMLANANRRGRIRGEIVVVPTVNPIGLAQLVGNTHLGRHDLLGRDNLNRNWPDLSVAVAERIGSRLARVPQACLAATIEYRGQHDVNHALGSADARNLYRFLTRRGIIAGRAGPLPRLKAQATPMAGMDVGYAPRTGTLVYHVKKGSRVRKDTPICEIIDPSDARGPKARTQVLSRTDGILFSRKPDGRLVWPGAVLYRIAGARPHAHRKGMSGLDD